MYKVGRLRLNQGRKLCNPSKENPFLLCAVSGVVEAPIVESIATDVNTLDDIVENQAYKICIARDNFISYMTCRSGRELNYQFYGDTNIDLADNWYFDIEDDGYYYIYCMNGSVRNYIHVTNSNQMQLSTEDKTLFKIEVTTNAPGTFYIYHRENNKDYALSVRGNKDFFLETRNNGANKNERVVLTKAVTYSYDAYELNEKTYGIAYHEESVTGAGLLSTTVMVNEQQRLKAIEMLVRPEVLSTEGELLITQTTDLSNWTFRCIRENIYSIETKVGSDTKYLDLTDGIISLSDTPVEIIVEAGSGEYTGKYIFKNANNYALTLEGGNINMGFRSSTTGGKYSWLNLVQKTNILTNEDLFCAQSL